MDIFPHRRIVLPLDVPTAKEAIDIAASLLQYVGVLKIGLQLFTAAGPSMLEMGSDYGLDIFLDLKLHDIPNTVANAVKSAAKHKVNYLTVHACGGSEMLKAAAYAAPPELKLLAVTLLTSIGEQAFKEELLIRDISTTAYVERMAETAWKAGIRGFVCSPSEVKALRTMFPEATLVVPGIRPAGSDVGDQARVGTPEEAIKNGANLLVIGRPILDAPDRQLAAMIIAQEIGSST
ncbi:MAG TPA: orotidine-5'-phosphate decarboxylase [Methylobacter sp.]|jgi:orotidine-5'-phosphate decarboxylase